MDTDVETATGGEKTAEEAGLWWKAPAAMVVVQLFISGMILLSKLAIGDGMFIFTLLAYRSIFGAAFILPIALIFESGKVEGDGLAGLPMDIRQRVHRGKVEGDGLAGLPMDILQRVHRYAVPMSLYYYGLQDTTPSYAVIFLNIIPLMTFIMSLTFRIEPLHFGTIAGLLKIVGVVLSVGGTMLISLYKGKMLHLWNPVLRHHKQEQVEVASHQLRGTLFLVGSSITLACWVMKVYPYKYWSSMATCLVGGFQTAFVGILLRRDWSAWKLGWEIQLLTIVYSGALATAGKYSLNSGAVAKRGPSDPPMFTPLSVVFTVLLDSIFIGDNISVGSLLGTTTVIAGLYVFLWAKSKELHGM
ncbi:hypothetical protein ACP4OV_010233 [Aristida adscensionis]